MTVNKINNTLPQISNDNDNLIELLNKEAPPFRRTIYLTHMNDNPIAITIEQLVRPSLVIVHTSGHSTP